MQQDAQSVSSKLPLQELPILVVQKANPNNPDRYKHFITNREKILRQLLLLKGDNEYYKDIEIDYATLSLLPINGSAFYSLRLHTDVDKKDAKDSEASNDGLKLGSAQEMTSHHPD